MTTSCPCCGSQVDRPVIVSLDTNVIATERGWVRVTPRCAEVVELLFRKYPAIVPNDDLGVSLWGNRYFDYHVDTLSAQIQITRKALAPIGLNIENQYDVGYRLSPSKTIEG